MRRQRPLPPPLVVAHALAGTVTSVNGNVYTFALICNDADVLAARRAMDEFTSALREF